MAQYIPPQQLLRTQGIPTPQTDQGFSVGAPTWPWYHTRSSQPAAFSHPYWSRFFAGGTSENPVMEEGSPLGNLQFPVKCRVVRKIHYTV